MRACLQQRAGLQRRGMFRNCHFSGNDNNCCPCNDDYCGYESQVSFAAVAATTYLIRIGGYLGDTGEGTLTITCGGGAPPMAPSKNRWN